VTVHTHYYNWKRHMIVTVIYLLLLLLMLLLQPRLTVQCKYTHPYRGIQPNTVSLRCNIITIDSTICSTRLYQHSYSPLRTPASRRLGGCCGSSSGRHSRCRCPQRPCACPLHIYMVYS
jgi:hypothetical protein